MGLSLLKSRYKVDDETLAWIFLEVGQFSPNTWVSVNACLETWCIIYFLETYYLLQCVLPMNLFIIGVLCESDSDSFIILITNQSYLVITYVFIYVNNINLITQILMSPLQLNDKSYG